MLNKKTLLIIGGVMVMAFSLVYATYTWLYANNQSNGNDSTQPSVQQPAATIEGNLVCLPKKGDGPQTMECAYGLVSGGTYYGLDMSGMGGQDLFEYTFEDVLIIKGDVINPDPNTSYDIQGTIKVTDFELKQASS